MQKKVLLLGAGGHAEVILDILEQRGKWDIEGCVVDWQPDQGEKRFGYPVIGRDEDLPAIFDKGIRNAIVAVGSIDSEGNSKRASLFQLLKDNDFNLINAIHEKAIIGSRTELGAGITFAASSCINPGSSIGDNVIVNTGAIVEHDCEVRDHVHISPGAKLAGNVTIGAKSAIGLGASIIQGVTIGENSTIGAGAVVVDDVPAGSKVAGVPAEPVDT